MNRFSIVVCSLVLVSVSGVADAGSASYRARITKILTDDTNYGECMFYTSPGPQNTSLSCKNNYVTVDCSGDFGSKSTSNTLFSTGQLAYVMGLTNVKFTISDSEKHNGYCKVTGITLE